MRSTFGILCTVDDALRFQVLTGLKGQFIFETWIIARIVWVLLSINHKNLNLTFDQWKHNNIYVIKFISKPISIRAQLDLS